MLISHSSHTYKTSNQNDVKCADFTFMTRIQNLKTKWCKVCWFHIHDIQNLKSKWGKVCWFHMTHTYKASSQNEVKCAGFTLHTYNASSQNEVKCAGFTLHTYKASSQNEVKCAGFTWCTHTMPQVKMMKTAHVKYARSDKAPQRHPVRWPTHSFHDLPSPTAGHRSKTVYNEKLLVLQN